MSQVTLPHFYFNIFQMLHVGNFKTKRFSPYQIVFTALQEESSVFPDTYSPDFSGSMFLIYLSFVHWLPFCILLVLHSFCNLVILLWTWHAFKNKHKYYKQQQSQALSSIWPSINYGGGQTCLPTQNAPLSLESDATAVGKNQFKKTVATIHTK